MAIQFEIFNRHSGSVQFVAEIECDERASLATKIGLAVRWAIKTRADLARADLAGANLARANLYSADLSYADLAGANLYSADLSYADLAYADLYSADLSYADLAGANLAGANLYSADLSYANLAGANLYSADLSYADLAYADLAGTGGIADRIIDGGLRSDGYRFYLTHTEPGEFRIKAGCRIFTISEARDHWDVTRPKGDPLGDETRLIIKHMLAVAKLRKWTPLPAEQE